MSISFKKFFKILRYLWIVVFLFFLISFILSKYLIRSPIINNSKIYSKVVNKDIDSNVWILSYSNFSKLVFHIWNENNYDELHEILLKNMCFMMNDLIYYCNTDLDISYLFNDGYDFIEDWKGKVFTNTLNNQKFTYIKNKEHIVFIIR